MRVVFCATCKGRAQHIERTLPQNLTDNWDYPDCRFVLLDYNSPDHLKEYLQSNHRTDIDSGKLIVYSHSEPGPFRMAHAKNMSHRLGLIEGADVLVNMDADNFTGHGFARYLANEFSNHRDLFMWSRMVKNGDGRLPRGISGRIAVSSKAFLNAGGYDEQFNTWSPDDKDFNERLRRLGYTAKEIEPRYLNAIMHNDKMRFKDYPHAKTDGGEDQFGEEVSNSDATVVNYGKIGNGVVFKNFGSDPIELGDVPTRIFGIGMHKTGTTSLHKALTILGFDSAHWTTAHWAKAIWEEMHAWGRSLTLERHYALSDLPITILYEKLDKAYPGSKFILTTRDENRWLKSVENHWSYEHNQFRAAWNTDPFSHRIHKEIYGQKGFNADIFLARFRRHNAEVQEYFRNRPNDLIVMDMDNGAGWDNLCRFLKKPVPSMPYPRSNWTKSSK